MVDVYHSGDRDLPKAPFLFMAVGDLVLPLHPAREDYAWHYWKEVPLSSIAVNPAKAFAEIARFGFHIQ